MTVLRLAGFGGENRALHPLLLPEMVGTTSLNQKPGRGDLRPWNGPSTVATLGLASSTIYRMGRDTARNTDYWLSWATEVHVVCAPNAADTAERTYYSGGAAFSPKWTNTAIGITANASLQSFPIACRELGVPAPVAACTLEHTPIAAISATAIVAATTYTIAFAGTTDFTLIGSTNSNVGTAFTATGPGAAGTTGTVRVQGLTETRYYTYTYVNTLGEESAPATPAGMTCLTNDTITISNLAATPSGQYDFSLKRIYRTQTGSSGTEFFFVKEIAATMTSTTDDSTYLGEVLPTTTWLMPPANLKWLTGLWNGMMCGISGRSVRFCEAYTYYAWPIAYEILPSNAQPVALATYGQTLVMLTNGNPSIITGGTPDAMDESPLEFYQACIAPQSAVGVGHGVVWASPDGLCYVGSGGARLLTEGVMTRDDWQAINPSSIKGCFYERRYIGFYTVTVGSGAGSVYQKAFAFDFGNPNGLYFMDFGATAVYLDDLQDALFVSNNAVVQKWDAGVALTTTFRSKLFRMPKPVVGFGCAEVTADWSEIGSGPNPASSMVVGDSYRIVETGTTSWTSIGADNGNVGTVFVKNSSTASGTGTVGVAAKHLVFNLYADGVLKHTQTVTDSTPFRLPSGYHAQTFQIEVSSTAPIQGVAVAHSMQELAQV